MALRLAKALLPMVLLPCCGVSTPESLAAERTWARPNRHDQARFKVAWELIRMGDSVTSRPDDHYLTTGEAEDATMYYQVALRLLKKNIARTPRAADIDYDHAWAAYCAAMLGEYAEAAAHYAYIREHCHGWQLSSGAHRNWDAKLREVRNILARSDDANAKEILPRMIEADERAAAKFRAEVIGLAREASNGDRSAIEKLKHRRYHSALVALLADKVLILNPEIQGGATPGKTGETVAEGAHDRPVQMSTAWGKARRRPDPRVRADAATPSEGEGRKE